MIKVNRSKVLGYGEVDEKILLAALMKERCEFF